MASYVQGVSSPSSGGSTATLTSAVATPPPAGTILIAAAQASTTGTSTFSDTISGSAGWETIKTESTSGGTLSVGVKIAVGGEQTITASTGTGTIDGVSCVELSGMGDIIVDASAVATSTGATTLTSGALTTTVATDFILAFVGMNASSGAVTNFTNTFTGSPSINYSSGAATRVWFGVGQTTSTTGGGTITATWTTSRAANMIVLAFEISYANLTASGSLSLSGAATETAQEGGSGALSFSGSATGVAKSGNNTSDSGSGSLSFSGAATETATEASAGSLALTGSVPSAAAVIGPNPTADPQASQLTKSLLFNIWNAGRTGNHHTGAELSWSDIDLWASGFGPELEQFFLSTGQYPAVYGWNYLNSWFGTANYNQWGVLETSLGSVLSTIETLSSYGSLLQLAWTPPSGPTNYNSTVTTLATSTIAAINAAGTLPVSVVSKFSSSGGNGVIVVGTGTSAALTTFTYTGISGNTLQGVAISTATCNGTVPTSTSVTLGTMIAPAALGSPNTALVSPSNAYPLQYSATAYQATGLGTSSSFASAQQYRANGNLNDQLDYLAIDIAALGAAGVVVQLRLFAEANYQGWFDVTWLPQLWRYTLCYLTGGAVQGFAGQPTLSSTPNANGATAVHNVLYAYAAALSIANNPPTAASLTLPEAELVDLLGADFYCATASDLAPTLGVMQNESIQITNATATSSTVTLTVGSTYGLTSGNSYALQGLGGGFSGLNGTSWPVTIISSTQFTIPAAGYSGASFASQTATPVSVAGNVLTFSSPPGVIPGQQVAASGIGGTWIVLGVSGNTVTVRGGTGTPTVTAYTFTACVAQGFQNTPAGASEWNGDVSTVNAAMALLPGFQQSAGATTVAAINAAGSLSGPFEYASYYGQFSSGGGTGYLQCSDGWHSFTYTGIFIASTLTGVVVNPNPITGPTTLGGSTVAANAWVSPQQPIDVSTWTSGSTFQAFFLDWQSLAVDQAFATSGKVAVPTTNGIQIVSYSAISPTPSTTAGVLYTFTVSSVSNPISSAVATASSITFTTSALQTGLLPGMTTTLSGFGGAWGTALNGQTVTVTATNPQALTFTIANTFGVAAGTYGSGGSPTFLPPTGSLFAPGANVAQIVTGQATSEAMNLASKASITTPTGDNQAYPAFGIFWDGSYGFSQLYQGNVGAILQDPTAINLSTPNAGGGSISAQGQATGASAFASAPSGSVAVSGSGAAGPTTRSSGSTALAGSATVSMQVAVTGSGSTAIVGTASAARGTSALAAGAFALAGTASVSYNLGALATASGALALSSASSSTATAKASGGLTIAGTASTGQVNFFVPAAGSLQLTSSVTSTIPAGASSVIGLVGYAAGQRGGTTDLGAGSVAFSGSATGTQWVPPQVGTVGVTVQVSASVGASVLLGPSVGVTVTEDMGVLR